MRGTIVGVLRGGPSREHDVSLKTGHAIIANLPRDRFTTRDIYIDKQGSWHERGVVTTPERVLRTVDVVIVGLHGEYGQDGKVQKLLEHFGVPYTGSDPFGSFISAHKLLAKEKAKEVGVLTPAYRYVPSLEEAPHIAAEAIRAFNQPVVVKPIGFGSSLGVSMPSGYAPVLAAVEELLREGAEGVLIEEYVRGTEATVGVVDSLRGERYYVLPPIEIVPPSSAGFFSYDAKYSGETEEIVPGRFSRPITEELMRQARLMHEALGQRHYSRSDFIVSPRGLYFLETNNAAAIGMTEESLLPKALAAVGVSFPEFLGHIVDLALARS